MNRSAVSFVPQVCHALWKDTMTSVLTPIICRLDSSFSDEAYRVEITQEAITITFSTRSGLLYAEQTLNQLKGQCEDTIPCGVIEDAPQYPFRSFHIDSARHMEPIEELKKMLDAAAVFKFNHFHWHLSDDQGWRIESKVFPRLHEIGSVRKGDHFGYYVSETEEGGYYTQDEIREIVSYAGDLGIEVIPEIDMPGHVSAILAAYPELSCTGAAQEVGTESGIFPDIFCAGKDAVFEFIEKMLDEICDLFPSELIHIGGDEAPKTRWESCPHCRRRMQEEELEDEQQLHGYFENRIIAYLKQKNRRAIVWNESAYGGNLDPSPLVQIWTEDKTHMVEKHIAQGGEMICSTMLNSYCDYPYGFISLKSMYEIDIPEQGCCGNECLIWTEHIRDAKRLESYAWPRFAAAAEAGWCGSGRPGYKDFARRMKDLLFVFDEAGIAYTEPDGWTPSKEESEAEIKEFFRNFVKVTEKDQRNQED